MNVLRTSFARFAADTRGQLSIEAAMMVPLIVWIYVTTFTYFETFRAEATNVKAAYTIGDMLSRETQAVDGPYIDGLNTVFAYMTLARQETWIRVSNVGYDGDTESFVLNWTYATDNHAVADLADLVEDIPAMTPGDTVIVVETFMPYKPEFNIGLKPFNFRNVVVTRPRFAPQLLWAS